MNVCSRRHDTFRAPPIHHRAPACGRGHPPCRASSCVQSVCRDCEGLVPSVGMIPGPLDTGPPFPYLEGSLKNMVITESDHRVLSKHTLAVMTSPWPKAGTAPSALSAGTGDTQASVETKFMLVLPQSDGNTELCHPRSCMEQMATLVFLDTAPFMSIPRQ